MTGVMLASCVALLLEYVLDKSRLAKSLEELFGGVVQEAALAVWIGLITLNLPLFLLDGQLIILHLFLQSRGLTTYGYIQLKRQELTQNQEEKESGQGAAGALQGRSLPRCMDWIVFSYRRARRRNDRRIVPTDEAGMEAAAELETSAKEEELRVPVHRRLPEPPKATATANEEAADLSAAKGVVPHQLEAVDVQAMSDYSTSIDPNSTQGC